jgi:hypothetical protein
MTFMNATERIDEEIAKFPDWRGEVLAKVRATIHSADPDIIEEWKWNSPVFSKNGIVCSISGFKSHVKMHFFKGANLKDPGGLINSGETAKQMRSIDWREGDLVDEEGLRELVREAIALNG